MAIAVPEMVVVLLCILAAGALVTAVAAFSKSIFGREQMELDRAQRSPEQDAYMRQVREQNRKLLWMQTKHLRRDERRHIPHRGDMDSSEADFQTRSYHSNSGGMQGGGDSRRASAYQQYGNAPVAYYEEEAYPEQENGEGEYYYYNNNNNNSSSSGNNSHNSQQRHHPHGPMFQNAAVHPKSGAVEIRSEVLR